MSQNESTTTRPKGSDSGSAPFRGNGFGTEAAGGEFESSCPSCGLYKWYPPLLLLSVIMAGVFCWMYITKPVFLSQPGNAPAVGARPALQERGPGDSSDAVPPTADYSGGESGGVLDPAVTSLPGDSASVVESDSGPEADAIPGVGLKPLRIRRGPALFRPFPVADQSTPAEGAGAGSSGSGLEEGNGSLTFAAARSDDETYRVPASFMAEFTTILDSDGSPDAEGISDELR